MHSILPRSSLTTTGFVWTGSWGMFLVRLLREEIGATAIEYGLIVALIAIAIITALTSTGNALTGVFNTVDTTLVAANG